MALSEFEAHCWLSPTPLSVSIRGGGHQATHKFR